MKKKTRLIAFAVALILAVNFSFSGAIRAFANSGMLDVDYDDCVASVGSDGVDEAWYVLREGSEYLRHLDHNTMTIKYKFVNEVPADLWEYYAPGADQQDLKDAYANSMKKWNNVFFYSYNSDGTVTKRKLINIVETSGEDYNLSIELKIIPSNNGITAAATTTSLNEYSETVPGCGDHEHCSKWKMVVNYPAFYAQGANTEHYNVIRERTGAHEIGHILGLYDVDNLCNAGQNVAAHHFEVLMGYGEPFDQRSTDITYKDIAGVAITRGFHTDDDHKWLDAGQQSDGTYKLICSICNGVKYVDSSSGYTCDTYGSCGGNHNLADGNMMAVASYGTKDYYKCKYCRYVAPFADNVEQNYVAITSIDSTQHKSINNVTGLSYAVYEEHSYNNCVYKNELYHTATCDCGYQRILMHWTKESELTGGRYERCAGCGAWIDLRDNILPGNPLSVVTKVSANGSYILPSGIAVVVDADVEAYMNETLIFYNPDDVPVTQ